MVIVVPFPKSDSGFIDKIGYLPLAETKARDGPGENRQIDELTSPVSLDGPNSFSPLVLALCSPASSYLREYNKRTQCSTNVCLISKL